MIKISANDVNELGVMNNNDEQLIIMIIFDTACDYDDPP